jgi:DNA-binding IclR family transcriptional regulator
MSRKQADTAGAGVAEGSPKYPIESVDNVLRLLLMVAEQGQIRVSQASAELGTGVSTAHRLLAMLSYHGFVVQDPDSKAYKAGHVLLRIGLNCVQNFDIRTLLRPYVEELRDETGETVHVAVLQGDQVLYIDCAESPMALRVTSRVGTLVLAHCTSVGKAWLASESDDFLRGLYPAHDRAGRGPQGRLLAQRRRERRRRGVAQLRGVRSSWETSRWDQRRRPTRPDDAGPLGRACYGRAAHQPGGGPDPALMR